MIFSNHTPFNDKSYKIFPLSYVYAYAQGTPFNNPMPATAALLLENKSERVEEFKEFLVRNKISCKYPDFSEFESFVKNNITLSERTELRDFFPSEFWLSLIIDFALYVGDEIIKNNLNKNLFWVVQNNHPLKPGFLTPPSITSTSELSKTMGRGKIDQVNFTEISIVEIFLEATRNYACFNRDLDYVRLLTTITNRIDEDIPENDVFNELSIKIDPSIKTSQDYILLKKILEEPVKSTEPFYKDNKYNVIDNIYPYIVKLLKKNERWTATFLINFYTDLLGNKGERVGEFKEFLVRNNISCEYPHFSEFKSFVKNNINPSERTELRDFFPSEFWLSLIIDFALYVGDEIIKNNPNKNLSWKVEEEKNIPELGVLTPGKKFIFKISDVLNDVIHFPSDVK